MVRDITWKDDEMRNENLNLIISESNSMSEMVNDILDYSQFSAGYSSLKKEWCDLRDIVTAELTRCRQAAAEHGITLTLLVTEKTSDQRSSAPADDAQSSRPFFFEIDALKMSQVMRNLLNNAINHTPENQEIRICLTPNPSARFQEIDDAPIPTGNTASFTDSTSAKAAFSASCCLVEVINPGEPIPAEDRAIIWERYQRSQHQNGRRLGTGIGLSIVSTILKAHQMPYGVDCQNGYNDFWFLCR